MAIITLTTDLGTKDSYLASVKGSIYSQLETAKIVDISNDITPFNIPQAAFVLRNCYVDFPKGTIHIISVDDELSVENEHLVVKANGHYFIGTDNGIFSLLLTEMKAEKIIQLNIVQDSNCLTFATKNIFSPAACHLARGGTMEMIGTEINDYLVHRTDLKAVKEKDLIKGVIVYNDNYGNAITNIDKAMFLEVQKGREFTIYYGREDEKITTISEKYNAVPPGNKLAIFGENQQLQIAMHKGKANTLLGLKLHEIIRIEFR
tara:strand:+ start:19 stop:804 length:786 start_codon:yes stop_codon:yes gene_type:complete